jgi:hypothetical protein
VVATSSSNVPPISAPGTGRRRRVSNEDTSKPTRERERQKLGARGSLS